MGFSTVTAQLMFFIAVVGISASVIAVFGSYLDQAKGAMTDKQQHVIGQLRTDIAVTNIYNQTGHLYVYAKNVGKSDLNTDCIELYVDSGWVNVGASQKVDPATGDAVTEWPPEATIELKPTSAPLNSGSVHKAKLITCNGVTTSLDF
jgi:archaellum component FlaG (FlaF/FlaG flagellin family)